MKGSSCFSYQHVAAPVTSHLLVVVWYFSHRAHLFGTWPLWNKSYKTVARRQAASDTAQQAVSRVLDDVRSVNIRWMDWKVYDGNTHKLKFRNWQISLVWLHSDAAHDTNRISNSLNTYAKIKISLYHLRSLRTRTYENGMITLLHFHFRKYWTDCKMLGHFTALSWEFKLAP
jgi:hypothetical protein